ncbi:MAG: hypothetical protein BJBARM4_0382 [Candidatus Parvarchaeum acidiphilum ARMAN-4]|uniref:Uncharacterized protein n=1 Tax=Candidatus Parvarchaeum acidiphilum ARMAN-4 TaxID=662760 RepID=D2EF70_PARA4|nr:MAG: hypothetical protein BJBARM4_0382 [Candidatus Parvarchaeum acidiphilum ARMAN-4]
MVVLRISTSFIWVLIAIIIILLAVFVFVKINKPSSVVSTSGIPSSIQYALEYWNAAYHDSTILVPSQYYKDATALSINGNKVVENNTLYSSVLFGSSKLPQGYNILIDMDNISSLPSVVAFSYNFTSENLSNSIKNCEVARAKTDAFALCSIYSNVTVPILNGTSINKSIDLGYGTFAAFPNSTALYELNGTLVYNGYNTTYIPSVNINNTNFYNGMMFLYENNLAVYLSRSDLNTFYGKEILLPNSTLKNVVANFLSARIIS